MTYFLIHPPCLAFSEPKSKPMEGPNMSQTMVIFTQIVERPARKLMLKRAKHAEIRDPVQVPRCE